ncbi:MAG: bifunctional phosphopantothenoylcysteine decarboxylase/phosphopantothenate--cysteine ligase CoaBC [Gammaproteobacteria bacterium]|nr:bifunctional phosphopantothenoylcysteine decarboxylase/phosphopantothenate--cysteine ligase CoaBC [Gammaproteobacteria bacterium]
MHELTNKQILLGICGGIAAYKSAELVRRLRDQGAQVRVMMTRAACQFITPLTMQAVSGHQVQLELLDLESESAFSHIDLARWGDVILIAPATANTLAKLAHGFADDLLSAVCLAAASAPIAVAPAMNQRMWTAAATQANCQSLLERDVRFFGPTEGAQACGDIGPGRMLEPEQLVNHLQDLVQPVRPVQPGVLQGVKVLVTAGPTREDIDPVRFISNRSSGRMGYAVARAAREAGAEVILVSGPTALEAPAEVKRISVYSAQDMLEAVLDTPADIFIAVAAVADYRPVRQAMQKIKKKLPELTLALERTPDILGEAAALPHPPFTVGFAAETECMEQYAKDKLKNKGLDMIAANRVGVEGSGFESAENALKVFWLPDGCVELPQAPKEKLAQQLIQVIAERYTKRQ